ncbi:MAG: hypothetical protein ASARMPREDX12_000515 [Alectoria sarmentosa]|nr:MAG: hypothetical protein ASARMPREDX12_000515 [Alectoria sarmentosa]
MKTPTLAFVPLLLHLAKAYTGDMTYYDAGLGSCGYTSTNADAIVALSTEIMNNGPNPNNNPICGSSINIYNPATGSTTAATIVDTCQGCAEYDIDVSPSVFETVDPNGLSDGRIVVDWGGSKVGGKKRAVSRFGRRGGFNGTD